MIERIEWSRLTRFDELPSPFMRGKGERPLRITLHSDSLAKLSGEEMDAVAVLREFGHLPEIQVVETKPGGYPHIEVGRVDPKANAIPVQIVFEGALRMLTAIWHPRQWPDIAAHLVGQPDPDHPDARAMLDVLIMAQAHCSIRGDILVTSSPLLLKHRNKTWLREANPRTPLEAAQIVGLFLRSRNIYTYTAGPDFQGRFDRGWFYWVLARYRLPRMWRYLSACIAASKTRGDDLQELGESILVRAVRALEARDAIGAAFYVPQNNNIADQMMYHFDYLTMVLVGALDAQARVAHRTYQVGSMQERFASFRQEKFRTALRRSGAQELCELLADQRFENLLTLLYEPRNTIHGAALKTIMYRGVSEPEHTFSIVPQSVGQKLWGAAERLEGVEEWGLTSHFQEVWLEPYSYATALVKEGLNIIDAVSAATDVNRLFPADQPIPSFSEEAPKDPVFRWAERIALLA